MEGLQQQAEQHCSAAEAPELQPSSSADGMLIGPTACGSLHKDQDSNSCKGKQDSLEAPCTLFVPAHHCNINGQPACRMKRETLMWIKSA